MKKLEKACINKILKWQVGVAVLRKKETIWKTQDSNRNHHQEQFKIKSCSLPNSDPLYPSINFMLFKMIK